VGSGPPQNNNPSCARVKAVRRVPKSFRPPTPSCSWRLQVVIVALVFGLLAEQLVFWLVLFAWAGLGAAIGPTSILAP